MQDRKASASGDPEVLDFINKKFNVDYRRIDIPQDQIGQKLPIMIASGDQIDFFSASAFGTSTTSLPALVENAMVQAVDEYLAKYGANLMKEIPEFAWKYVTYNGKKMSVPDMGFKSKRFLFVRRDWMDNLGIKDPQNYTEFEQMLKKMKTTDPDGTGAKQRYPLGTFTTVDYFDTCFLSAFVPAGKSWYLEKDGSLVPWFMHPGFKDYMTTFARWYKEGLIHPDVMILGREELKSVVVQGMVGVWPMWYTLSFQDELTTASPKSKVDYIWWPKGPTGQSGAMSEGAFNTQMVVHAKAQKKVIERVFQIMDWFQTPEGTDFQWYGIEGKHYVKKDGVISDRAGHRPEEPGLQGAAVHQRRGRVEVLLRVGPHPAADHLSGAAGRPPRRVPHDRRRGLHVPLQLGGDEVDRSHGRPQQDVQRDVCQRAHGQAAGRLHRPVHQGVEEQGRRYLHRRDHRSVQQAARRLQVARTTMTRGRLPKAAASHGDPGR